MSSATSRFLLLFCFILLCAACSPSHAASVVSATSPTQAPVAVNVDEAQRIAADFLNAWVRSDYDAMYSLLSPNSRDAFSRKNFEAYYADAEQTMTLLGQGKTYILTNLIQQNTDVDIAYDMTFKTRLLGGFTDQTRILHLVNTSEGWRVGWSQADVFKEMKDGAYLDLQTNTPNRGNIYDRDGQVIADQNGVAIDVILLTKAYPTGNPDQCFAALARVFPQRTAEQMKKAYGDRTGRDFAFQIGELSQDTFATERPSLERVCTLKYDTHPTRRYVAGGLAPHIVGYVGRIPAESVDQWVAQGYSPDSLVGIDGIEKYWESTLAGRGEAKLVLVQRGSIVRTLADRPAQPSQSVYLSLDRKLQEATQTMLADAFANSVWGSWATGAAAVVMDVHTGEIRAIASYPSFNVDAFNPYTSMKDAQEQINAWTKDPKRPTFNRATLGQYPAGSVFKIVSMAAAADSGKFGLNTVYTCTGTWNGTPIGDRTRRDWIYFTQAGAHGSITLKQALTGSCDTYFWNVGWTLNKADPHILIDYAKRMGFGATTGIKDVGESTGNLPDPDTIQTLTGQKWRPSDALNIVIGQGDVQVTPLQVTRMVAAVANGGTLFQPLLVEKVGIIGEPSYVAQPVANGQLGVKPEILQAIRDSMCGVTTNPTLGTAEFVFRDFKGAAVCGKTGTAQAGLAEDQPHAWFAAFAGKTADKPEIAVVVIVEHSNEGSYIAAPVVRRIVETYYDLPITPWPSWYGGGLPTTRSGE